MSAPALPVTFNDPTKDRLLGLLAAGVSQTSAALAIGVSDSYVSQLLSDLDFSTALSLQRTEKLEGAIKHDNTITTLEERTLRVLDQKLPFIRNAVEAARVFDILNKANRKTELAGMNAEALGAQQVTIILPKAAKVQISVNSSSQVIEVQGRSMATLPSRALPQLAQDILAKQKQLESSDKERAGEILAQVSNMTTRIGKVDLVL